LLEDGDVSLFNYFGLFAFDDEGGAVREAEAGEGGVVGEEAVAGLAGDLPAGPKWGKTTNCGAKAKPFRESAGSAGAGGALEAGQRPPSVAMHVKAIRMGRCQVGVA
jgi:hypothetical protein